MRVDQPNARSSMRMTSDPCASQLGRLSSDKASAPGTPAGGAVPVMRSTAGGGCVRPGAVDGEARAHRRATGSRRADDLVGPAPRKTEVGLEAASRNFQQSPVEARDHPRLVAADCYTRHRRIAQASAGGDGEGHLGAWPHGSSMLAVAGDTVTRPRPASPCVRSGTGSRHAPQDRGGV